jgi:cystathionine gamma-synthase
MDIKTLCIHGNDKKYDTTGAVSVPIFQSATFTHPGVGSSTGFDYSRESNPTREHLERTIAGLEHGVDAIAFASGMAAVTVFMGLFPPGSHIIASDDLYGGTHRLFFQLGEKYGQTFTLVDTGDLDAVRGAITENTRAIFVETPTNPMMQVSDITAVAAIAHERDIIVIVDNTFLTPYLQNPITLGADAVLHSGTKYLGGHNDTLAGFLIVNSAELSARLRFIAKTVGAGLAPFDSWLLIRGIKTLAVRVERQQENAKKIAEWLLLQKNVTDVFYPGLPTHPGYEILARQARGAGAMISFNAKDEDLARAILARVKVISYAESLGGVESLITYPMLQTHADIPVAERERKGIGERLLRLSVGLEDAEDLIADLDNAINN